MAAQPTSYVLAGACLKNNRLIGCALERTECCLVDNENSNCSSISSSDDDHNNFGNNNNNQTDDHVVVFRSSRQLSLTERPVGGVCLQQTSTVPIGECPSDGFCASTKSSCTNPDEFVTAYHKNNSSESCGLQQSQTTTPNNNINNIVNNNNNTTIPTQYGACLSNQTDTDATITTSIKFECLWSRRDCRSDWWLLPFSTTLANSDPSSSSSSSSSSCGCDQVQTGACVSAEGLYCAVSAEGCDDSSVFVPYHDLQVDCRLCPPLPTPRPSPNPTLPLPTPSPTPNPTYTPLPPYSPRPTAPTSTTTTIRVVEPTNNNNNNNNGSSPLLIGVVTGIVGALLISLVVGIVWFVTKREAEWNKQHFADQDRHDEEQEEEDGQGRFKDNKGAAGATAAAHDSYEFQRNPHELT